MTVSCRGEGSLSLLILGLNHRTAPLDLRERLNITVDKLPEALATLSQKLGQGVVISTCNRLEVYTLDQEESGRAWLLGQFLSEQAGVSQAELQPFLYQYEGSDCVGHLFQVAAGLDSMVVGETQILGQVRTAYSRASDERSVRGPLSRLFHQALRVGRRVQRETQIARHSRSVSQAAVQLAQRLQGDLSQRRALVIGAGDAGRLVAKALSDAGIREIVVTNRTQWRAEDLARELGGVSAPYEDLQPQLAHADVVISSTGSPGYLIDKAMVLESMSGRGERPLLLIDIAVPRDIDPWVGELAGVELYDIDSLSIASEIEPEGLQRDLGLAQEIVTEELLKFMDWWESLEMVPVITAIRERAEDIRQAEVAKTLRKVKFQWGSEIPDDCMVRLSDQLEAMSAALIKKLLHDPTVYLREGRDVARQQLAREIFNLGELSVPTGEADSMKRLEGGEIGGK